MRRARRLCLPTKLTRLAGESWAPSERRRGCLMIAEDLGGGIQILAAGDLPARHRVQDGVGQSSE